MRVAVEEELKVLLGNHLFGVSGVCVCECVCECGVSVWVCIYTYQQLHVGDAHDRGAADSSQEKRDFPEQGSVAQDDPNQRKTQSACVYV